MDHIMAMLLSFYMAHTPNPNPRLELALEYLADRTQCSPMYLSYDEVDYNVYAILWQGKGPHCKESSNGCR